jgi:hypothetical protein
MKRKISVLAGLLLAGMAASSAAWADHGHFHGGFHHTHARVGVFVGVPLGPYPYPYYYPRYYYPAPVVVAPASPPVYIEQGEAAPSSNSWYYCQNPQGYYPYVKECPGGWQQVSPQPPTQ